MTIVSQETLAKQLKRTFSDLQTDLTRFLKIVGDVETHRGEAETSLLFAFKDIDVSISQLETLERENSEMKGALGSLGDDALMNIIPETPAAKWFECPCTINREIDEYVFRDDCPIHSGMTS